MQLDLERRSSPLGTMLVVTDEKGVLRALDFEDFEARLHRLLRLHYGAVTLKEGRAPAAITTALETYFVGDARVLDGVEVATGGTAFQRQAWAALRTIPPGETWSYSRQATHIGRPAAVRAIGMANGANPVAIVVPCHRVIGANASLTGYGGGLERKRWLLEHEGVRLAARSSFKGD